MKTKIIGKSLRSARKVVRWTERRVSGLKQEQEDKRSLKQLKETNVRNDILVLRSGSRRMMFRISDKLNFGKHRQESFGMFKGFLTDELRVRNWVLGSSTSEFRSLNVLSQDRAAVLKFLRGRAELNHWYYQEVKSSFKLSGRPMPLKFIDPLNDFAAIRVYERVAFDSNSNFRVGAREGVEIHFWDQGFLSTEHPAKDQLNTNGLQIIEPRHWNPVVTVLPDPSSSKEAFDLALEAAVRPHHTDVNFPIDAVYTWVDGSDPKWQASKASALNLSDTENLIDQAVSDARFADHDELRYSLRSIDQFAPWIRKVWIVTAGQTPSWLDVSNPRVQIVDHKDIWPDSQGMPNFNSHAIEANLHRINGLTDHFLYLNDDFILTRPVKPSLFFHGNGISKVFFSRAMVDFDEISEIDNASTIAAKNARKVLASGYGNFSRKFFHAPSALNRKVIERAEKEFAEIFTLTRNARFRQPTDIAVAGSFYFNYALSCGDAVPASIKYDYIDPATDEGRSRMNRVIRRRDKDCIVVNDGSSPENQLERGLTDRFIRNSLSSLLPVRSEFEL